MVASADTDGLLGWRDLGRGLMRLARKAPALMKTAARMSLTPAQAPVSLASLVEGNARTLGHRPAVKSGDGDLTYAQLNARANRTARLLESRSHVSAGDTVAVIMSNRPEMLVAVLACAKLGAVASMINVNQRRAALAHSLACAPPSAVIVGAELLDALRAAGSELPEPLFVVADGAVEGPDGLDVVRERRAFASTDLARNVTFGDDLFYIFTSGTTGLPKAAIMSQKRWIGAGYMFGGVCLGLRETDTIYCPLPLYHNQALTMSWSSAIHAGAAIAVRRAFSASEFWQDCARFDATAIAYIGEIARYLLSAPKGPQDRAHRVTKAAGVGMRPELWFPFKTRFGVEEVYEYYGASELNVGFFNVMNLDQTVGFCPGSWALVDVDVDTGEPRRGDDGRLRRIAGRGDTGLLITEVSDRFKFEGYTDREATEKKLLRDVFEPGDVWVNTGDVMRDIGFGHVQFVDRLGDTFRWKGENVATSEVEKVVASVDGVADCAVYGVTVPDRSGRAGMAALVLEDPKRAASVMAALHSRMAAELPAYASPVFVRVVPELELTGTFKHKKAGLRREGFDPDAVDGDPLYVHLASEGGYVPLNAQRFAAIIAGEARL